MSERDELRGTLANTICNASNYAKRAQPYLLGSDMSDLLDKTADAILAAGYRKPRTITTAEELDALAIGSVVLDHTGDVLKRSTRTVWLSTDEDGATYVVLPATILEQP